MRNDQRWVLTSARAMTWCAIGYGAYAVVTAQNRVESSTPQSEEYLVLGDATRGAGEPMIAVDPTDPRHMIIVAMANLHMIGETPPVEPQQAATPIRGRLAGESLPGSTLRRYHVTADSTVTMVAVTHDRGRTWKVRELPVRDATRNRCPDAFAAVGPDGTFYAGCEPRETAGEFYGSSSVVVSTDKGETWGKPVEVVSSYTPERFAPDLKPIFAAASPWDRPWIKVDQFTNIVYGAATGGNTGDPPRTQGYVTASLDRGASFGTIYAFDSKEYPESGRGDLAAGHGVLAVIYPASSVPASENATCPCLVFGISRNHGKSFEHRALPSDFLVQQGGGPGGGSGLKLAVDPTNAGRFALMRSVARNTRLEVSITADYGKTWSTFAPAGQTPNATLTKPWIDYSRKGVLALMWRAVYPDRSCDIFSAASHDGGKVFTGPVKVSHASSPAPSRERGGGLFGDDIQNLVADDDYVHMVWGDSRAGFQGVWYSRLPISAYSSVAPTSAPIGK